MLRELSIGFQTLAFRVRHALGELLRRGLALAYLPYVRLRACRIRHKKKIRVLFVLAELGAWKTEALYCAMAQHPRFEPILGVTTSREVAGSKEPLMDYIRSKGYPFVDLDASPGSINMLHPDIKFYYKPYNGSYPQQHIYKRHMDSLTCHIPYDSDLMATMGCMYRPIMDFCWFVFAGNELIAQKKRELLGWRAHNVRVTGLPVQDVLRRPKENYTDCWKAQPAPKKRIIYAPHHSFRGTNPGGIEFATFLDFGEFMLEMAQKYQDQVQWAFKPHPTLYRKLSSIWGEARTAAYYRAWERGSNTQLELGAYDALFKYSDAMIHDCGSFIAEYHYTLNRSLFLQMDPVNTDNMNEYGKTAFRMQDFAKDKEEIEAFINDVIEGRDPRRQEREELFNRYFLPPMGRSACDNIIETILGNEAPYRYKA